jgi:Spy/CpxP family protein refolding chaperone
MSATWAEIAPRLDAITDSARVEIMQVLTPEQQADYERRLEERAREREQRRLERDEG